jgi:two-component system chemotaxis response regulator CheY
MLRTHLEPQGHEVIEAPNGPAALELYFLEKPELVFLDLTMTEMHGLEVLERLREMDPRARVIVATADIQRASRELALAGGASFFLNKPFSKESVLSAVQEVLKVNQDEADGTPG